MVVLLAFYLLPRTRIPAFPFVCETTSKSVEKEEGDEREPSCPTRIDLRGFPLSNSPKVSLSQKRAPSKGGPFRCKTPQTTPKTGLLLGFLFNLLQKRLASKNGETTTHLGMCQSRGTPKKAVLRFGFPFKVKRVPWKEALCTRNAIAKARSHLVAGQVLHHEGGFGALVAAKPPRGILGFPGA